MGCELSETTDGEELTEMELIAYCRPRLGGIKTPKRVVFVPEIPRSANGKVLKKHVREPFWRGHERQI
jgi:acyl-CoA synthetase (AMP-forming)/AMP-acid ligase II